MDQVAAEARKIKMEREGETKVRGMEDVEKKVAVPEVEKVEDKTAEGETEV